MKSRLPVFAALVAALVFSTGGAALALQSGTNASIAQYGSTVVPAGTPTPSATSEAGVPRTRRPGPTPTVEVSPTFIQAERQHEVGVNTKRLPFTGFAAIPVLLGGIALVAGGHVLRRRTGAD
jgi:hypothetical protein